MQITRGEKRQSGAWEQTGGIEREEQNNEPAEKVWYLLSEEARQETPFRSLSQRQWQELCSQVSELPGVFCQRGTRAAPGPSAQGGSGFAGGGRPDPSGSLCYERRSQFALVTHVKVPTKLFSSLLARQKKSP